MHYSVSYTTREPRKGEENGVDYFFISKEDFIRGIDTGAWVEWAEVHDNFYGTALEFLKSGISSGRDILLDIDVQGTLQILKQFPESITIFIMPPSLDILRQRIERRGTDSREVIEKRLENARGEIEGKKHYSHVIVNDQLEKAFSELIDIILQYPG